MLQIVSLLSVILLAVSGRISVAYYTADSVYVGFPLALIPYSKITHLNYAFAGVLENGTVTIGDLTAAEQFNGPNIVNVNCSGGQTGIQGNLGALWTIRKQYPHLRVMLSIGGFNQNITAAFTKLVQTEETRENFAKSATALVARYGFDGVDIDYEYPYTEDDNKNLVKLMEQTRSALNDLSEKDGKKYAMSAAVPATLSLVKSMKNGEFARICDWLNLMTYDFSADVPVIYHDSQLYQTAEFNLQRSGLKSSTGLDYNGDFGVRNIKDSVIGMISAGVPNNKIVLGLPLYGYHYEGVQVSDAPTAKNPRLLGQSFNGSSTTAVKTAKAISWGDILTKINGNGSPFNWRRFRDESAIASYVWNPYTFEAIVFSDAQVGVSPVQIEGKTAGSKSDLQERLDFVKEYDLGGVMFWQISQDTSIPGSSIVNQCSQALFGPAGVVGLKFPVCAPTSEVCNIRSECRGSFEGADSTSTGSVIRQSWLLAIVILATSLIVC